MKLHPDDTEDDYAIFGKIVLLWSRVEAILITIIYAMIFEPGGLRQKGIPQNFAERIKTAVRGYETLAYYAAIKDEAVEAVKALEPLHEKRTVIVHGLYNGKTLPGRYVFGLVKWGKSDRGTVHTHTFTRAELDDLTTAIAEATLRLDLILTKTKASRPWPW